MIYQTNTGTNNCQTTYSIVYSNEIVSTTLCIRELDRLNMELIFNNDRIALKIVAHIKNGHTECVTGLD
jgi:hypothetical protein